MTRDEITAKWAWFSARERDAWVERAVFGRETFGQFREVNGVRVHISRYSTDISAAWAVLGTFPYATVDISPDHVEAFVWDDDGRRSDAVQPEAPGAICLAALIAKLTEVPANVAV